MGRKTVSVKIWNKGSQPTPAYAHDGDSGMDIRADANLVLGPGETKLVGTGIHVGIPEGYEIQARPRSGMSFKTKLRIANSPGTIDHPYTGEISIICENIGVDPIVITAGDRIAQIVLQKVPAIEWVVVDTEEELGATTRAGSGFGSTGTK